MEIAPPPFSDNPSPQANSRDLLDRASTESLATSFEREVLRKGGQSQLPRFPALPKVLGQVQRYAQLFRVRWAFPPASYQAAALPD